MIVVMMTGAPVIKIIMTGAPVMIAMMMTGAPDMIVVMMTGAPVINYWPQSLMTGAPKLFEKWPPPEEYH